MRKLTQLKELPYIRKNNFQLLFPDIKLSSFNQNIKNWLKSGKLIKLKNGFYISNEYWENYRNKDEYLYYLSSLLRLPSYISRETVLAKYGVLTESVFGISAVTNSATKNFNSKIANFSYSKIKKELFVGYTEKTFDGKRYDMATLSKALFDYLYFVKRNMKYINKKTVSELRLNTEVFSKDDWKEFEKYLQLANSEKMRRIYNLLRASDAS